MAPASRPAAAAAAGFAIALLAGFASASLRGAPAGVPPAASDGSCVRCHAGIEDMHPKKHLSCVECHGGDGSKEKKEEAHVPARMPLPNDERVPAQGNDLPFLRFRNPTDLRVAADTCGTCHPDECERVPRSLHGTTSGHLGDGLYENGVSRDKGPLVGIFPVSDPVFDAKTAPKGAVARLNQIQGFRTAGDRSKLATHFSDVPRKNCMQCHLWSRGRAVRGRLGMDGDYRGDGCAACHVPYEDDGISRSKDRAISRVEAGHPTAHSMVRVPRTDACIRCHYGDASIGLSYRGLAQPVPGMPQSPDAAGFARKRLNGVFYVNDPAITPPDLHYLAGMSCTDCHTGYDTMGDGRIYTRMEDGVEMECWTCHGTPAAYASGKTERGRPVRGLERRTDGTWLRAPTDGRLRRVKQARDVVNPGSADYNPRAAQAMTQDHARLECYACHTGWTPNFFGFHFDRNEQFSQLDVLDGDRTVGRVNTQEKVFATFRQHYLGWNSEGFLAPYMVGFSTMATVHGKDGELLLDQEMPVTSAGLSGMTMIHHQPHATTARARTCVECHRAPESWGLGSVNFRLTRELLYAAGERGVQVIGFDRKTPANTRSVGQVGIPGVRAFEVRCDDLQGRSLYGYAATAEGALVAVDLRNPLFPKESGTVSRVLTDPRQILVSGTTLFVADGKGGVRVFDAETWSRPRLVATLETKEARGLFLDGIFLYVADGVGGLKVADVHDPAKPVLLSSVKLGGEETLPDDASSVSVMFQYSRPNPADPSGPRVPPRNLAVVGVRNGLVLVDATQPAAPRVLGRLFEGNAVAAVALGTIYELGSEGGGIRSRERDFAFVLTPQALVLLDVTEPGIFGIDPGALEGLRPAELQQRLQAEFADRIKIIPIPGVARSLKVLRAYNPPFLQTFAMVGTANGVVLAEVTRPSAPVLAGAVAQPGTAVVAAEEFPLDRMVGLDGKPLKDVSHEGARYLDAEEIRRVLGVPLGENR